MAAPPDQNGLAPQAAQVRRATVSDASALVELRAEMFRAMGSDLSDEPAWREAASEWFAARLDHPDYGIFVVEVDGGVVASAAGAIRDAAPSPSCPEGRDVLINNVCTLPQHRGSGYGSLAFGAVMDWARGTGVARAELMATPGGRHIYERAGFAVTTAPAMRATL